LWRQSHLKNDWRQRRFRAPMSPEPRARRNVFKEWIYLRRCNWKISDKRKKPKRNAPQPARSKTRRPGLRGRIPPELLATSLAPRRLGGRSERFVFVAILHNLSRIRAASGRPGRPSPICLQNVTAAAAVVVVSPGLYTRLRSAYTIDLIVRATSSTCRSKNDGLVCSPSRRQMAYSNKRSGPERALFRTQQAEETCFVYCRRWNQSPANDERSRPL